MSHEGFEGKGRGESLKVESNTGYSIKPSVGLMLETEKSTGSDREWKIKTNGIAGVELKDRYGIFLTGEFGIGNSNKEECKVGVSFKVLF